MKFVKLAIDDSPTKRYGPKIELAGFITIRRRDCGIGVSVRACLGHDQLVGDTSGMGLVHVKAVKNSCNTVHSVVYEFVFSTTEWRPIMINPIQFTDDQCKQIASENLNQLPSTFDLRRGAVCFHYANDAQKEDIFASLNIIGVTPTKLTPGASNQQGWPMAASSSDGGYADIASQSYVGIAGAENWKILAETGVTFPGHAIMGTPKKEWAKR